MQPSIGNVFHSGIPPVSQAQINTFGELHGTNGPSHTDPEYAKNSIFGGVIVQGALVMAPVLGILRRVAGLGPQANLSGETKFVSYTRPGEALSVRVEVIGAGPGRIELDYSCATADGRVVQVGVMTCESNTQEET